MRQKINRTVRSVFSVFAACGVSSAFGAVTFQENFMNYADRVPGMVIDDACVSVDNDPIWTSSGGVNFRLKETKSVYVNPIPLPKGRFDLSFDYRFLNSVFPVEAKGGKPAVAADWSCFELVFSAGGREEKIRIGADRIGDTALAVKTPNYQWRALGVRAKGRHLEIYFASARRFEKLASRDLGFVPERFNFVALANRHFGLTNLLVSDGDGLPEHPASAHFADYASLAQPVAGAKVATAGEKLTLAPAPKAGVRLTLGSTNATVKLAIKWSDGSESGGVIRSEGFTDARQSEIRGFPKGTKCLFADAKIAVPGTQGLSVRPALNLFRSSYSIEPQGVDVIRDWDTLPAASAHPLDLDLVKVGGDVQLWIDGSFVSVLKPDKKAASDAAFVAAELTFDGGVKYAKRTLPKSDDSRFTVLDFSANPRAKAFASAELKGLVSGDATFGGYPVSVASPLDSADIAICHQAMGNWGLEVEEYHGRSPLDGYPSAVHYRVPAAPYVRAGVLFALDPDPRKDAILTLRVGRYRKNGSGGNLSSAATYDFSQGVPAWCAKVGDVERDGKRVPLYFGDFALNLGPVVDLAGGDYLDFDITGRQWENFQQMDNSMKPDPRSDSAFNLFGCTLKKASSVFSVVENTAGNVFTADEKTRGMKLSVRALTDGAKGTLRWTAKDVEGNVVFSDRKDFSLARVGDRDEVPVDFGAETSEGFYTCEIESLDGDGVSLFTHVARFAILPAAGRQVSKFDSPYATWWFNSHGSPGDEMAGCPIMSKAGIRKCSWRKPTKAESEKWDITSTGNTFAMGESEFEMNADGVTGRFKSAKVQKPDPADPTGKKKITVEVDGERRFVEHLQKQIDGQVWADHVLIWHESGPRGGVPEELLGLPLPDPSERDRKQAAYVNEIGRLVRRHFPGLRLQIGNNSAAMGAASKPMRYGAKGEYFDSLGMETPAQVVPPERRTEVGVLGMLASQDVASRYAGRKVPLNGAWEFIYRADRDMGEELQAEWHARDVLICLAHDFKLISPGILFDCDNGYYNGLWGGAGLLQRAPTLYPKRAYVAFAVITKVFDGVRFSRSLDTGSATVYAMEYKRSDGRFVTAFWCARGEATFALAGADGAVVTEMYGKSGALAKDGTLTAGGRPVYVTTAKPLDAIRVVKRAFPFDAALAARSVTAAALDKVEDFTLDPDPGLASTHHDFFPVLKPGAFTLKGVNDEEKGACLEVTLDLAKNTDVSPYYTEYTTVRFNEPKTLEGNPELIGVWVKGNSNWGQIRFEIEDADGEIFKNLSTGKSWACDIMDWPGNLAVNFDGWNFVYTTLRATDLLPVHSPGPYSDQWVSCGGDKRIRFPVKVRAVSVGMNRYPTSFFGFADKPGNPSIRLKDVGGIRSR